MQRFQRWELRRQELRGRTFQRQGKPLALGICTESDGDAKARYSKVRGSEGKSSEARGSESFRRKHNFSYLLTAFLSGNLFLDIFGLWASSLLEITQQWNEATSRYEINVARLGLLLLLFPRRLFKDLKQVLRKQALV